MAGTPGSLHCGAGLAGCDVGLEVAFLSGSGRPRAEVEAWRQ